MPGSGRLVEMILKIEMKQVASYKKSVIVQTDKKINLIYGLNGTGKSTFSCFLYNPDKPEYSQCSIEGLSDEEILVYNQQFIKDYFYQPDSLKGIFTLSKENKQAEQAIKAATKEVARLEQLNSSKKDDISKKQTELIQNEQNAENKIWEIKTEYSGGDRVFEYCLAGLMGRKNSLFVYIADIQKPDEKPKKTIKELKEEAEAIKGDSAQKYELIQEYKQKLEEIEIDEIFQKEIIGNENSTVAGLIKELKNSDWVKMGLKYIPDVVSKEGERCPFCQKKTITNDLAENIKNYFDVSYEQDIEKIKKLKGLYENYSEQLPKIDIIDGISILKEKKEKFGTQINTVKVVLEKNISKIESKLSSPSTEVFLENSEDSISELNKVINEINAILVQHNSKIDNKENTLKEIKKSFWEIMRWDYDQTISAYFNSKKTLDDSVTELRKELAILETKIYAQKTIITERQKNTVNIEEAINNINNGLTELGIDGFSIEKHTDVLYKIARKDYCEDTFDTLSEGEKMIISFLYFRELFKGKKSSTSVASKKIVVIDDPISSLSHIFVFNIGQMIKNDFFNSPDSEQVFLLTHSLYFFYEMTDINKERRKENQKLFRMMKNSEGSSVCEMKYEEIQNDYHSYWYVIKDESQPAPLIANCMRNIIEYFFNFIEKKDLNNVFQKPVLKDNKYQAFCRYINRESHSLGQNIFDFKEFDYTIFKEALGHVFIESGYKEHYEVMMK